MKIRLFAAVISGIVMCTALAFAATPIKGVITAKRGNEVQVKLSNTALTTPKAGDPVSFMVIMDGLEVDAGTGKVSKVNGAEIWVTVTEGNPNIEMQATIEASGTASSAAKPIGKPFVGIATTDLTPDIAKSPASTPSSASLSCVYGELMPARGIYNPEKSADVRDVERKARKKKSIAIDTLAYWYAAGKGAFTQNTAEAVRLYEKGLQEKSYLTDPHSFNLALIYHVGLGGFPKNPTRAKAVYEKGIGWPAWKKGANAFSAVQDPLEPQLIHNLGCLYLNGEGVAANRDVALELFQKAADRGSKRSAQILKELTH